MKVIENISELITIPNDGRHPKRGEGMRDLGIIRNVNLWIEDGKVLRITREMPDRVDEKIDARGKVVMPSFVDPHTHPVFSGYRDFELSLKISGKTYQDILKSGGGIFYTVDRTREASEDELFRESSKRIEYMIKHGTLAAESKSGYGLDLENELKILKVIRRLSREYPITLVPTFLLHVVPRKREEGDYVLEMIDALDTLKRYAVNVDVFCDKGAFSSQWTEIFLKKAREKGFNLKMHADELEYIGCSSLINKLDFISMDHLIKTPDEVIVEMSRKDTVAVLLPGTPFTLLEDKYANARKFIDNNVPVAVGTDLNPNCYTESMQEIIALSIYKMRMSVEEAITASTYNAAFATGVQDRYGSIGEGKEANLLILDIPSYTHLGYHFGVNLVSDIVWKGELI
ncbi:MAG: imidazolonepropionase [Thermoplasmata archaeon]|jgi:imidazolonepropionase|nr:MAG: imidazolonepropionase [Aciduliprofundum sp.]